MTREDVPRVVTLPVTNVMEIMDQMAKLIAYQVTQEHVSVRTVFKNLLFFVIST